MGMFDSIYMLGDMAMRVCCPAGHPQRGELQTKDLDSVMDTYYVYNGLLYGASRLRGRPLEVPSVEDGCLAITSRYLYPRSTYTGEVTAYTSCHECEPVVYKCTPSVWTGNVDGCYPWLEWTLTFKNGALADVRLERVESREDVRAKLNAGWTPTLPDDDRVAKRYMAQERKNDLR